MRTSLDSLGQLDGEQVDPSEREQHTGIDRARHGVQPRGRACRIVRVLEREDQDGAILGKIHRAVAEQLGDGNIRDLELEGVRVDPWARGDFVDGLEADTKETDLILALGGLTDARHADEIARVERVAIVPDDDPVDIEDHAPVLGSSILGVLE